MTSPIAINTILAFIMIMIGLMFIEGIWHNKGKIIKNRFDIDHFFFPDLKEKKILNMGDRLAAAICFLMATLTLLNGAASFFIKAIPNISAIFVFIAVFLAWPIRIFFIFFYRKKRF